MLCIVDSVMIISSIWSSIVDPTGICLLACRVSSQIQLFAWFVTRLLQPACSKHRPALLPAGWEHFMELQ
jgi:hypothetical protein